MNLLENPDIWYTVSFVIFICVAYHFGRRSVLQKLDSRIESIKQEIESAESLRVEAQELLAQYQRKQRDAMQESEKIIENAKEHATEIRRKAEEDLEHTLNKKEEQLQERIRRMEENAMQEIQSYAADLAVSATTQIISQKMDKKSGTALIDQTIDNLPKELN